MHDGTQVQDARDEGDASTEGDPREGNVDNRPEFEFSCMRCSKMIERRLKNGKVSLTMILHKKDSGAVMHRTASSFVPE